MKGTYKNVVSFYLKHGRRFKYSLLSTIVLCSIAYFIGTINPLIFKDIITLVSENGLNPESVSDQLFRLFFILALTYLLSWGLWRSFESANVYNQVKTMESINVSAFDYIHKHSHKFFSNTFAGSINKRIGRLVWGYASLLDILVFSILNFVITVGSILVILYLQNWMIGAIYTGWGVVFGIIAFYLYKWKSKYDILSAEQDTKLSGYMVDTMTNNPTISSFSKYGFEGSLVRTNTTKWKMATFNAWWRDIILYAGLSFLLLGLELGVLYVLIEMWIQGEIDLGLIYLVIAYQASIFGQFISMSNVFKRLFSNLSEAMEGVDMLVKPHDILDVPGAPDLHVSKGHIQFQDVQFYYNEANPILKKLSLDIQPGKKVAIVGHSGAGKSTVIKLIQRLYDINGGKILIDGQDISQITQESLRKNVVLVPQDPILFHRSLRDNIAYGGDNPTEEEVMEASKLAHCHEFIVKLEKGYETLVGERGIKLSGGERQRVAIARAFLSPAKIVIFDEATSSLDSESESYIQEAMQNVLKDRTAIIIAHRLSTIMKSDTIIVMEAGEVVEIGTHQELLRNSHGMYKKLWDIQSGDFIGE